MATVYISNESKDLADRLARSRGDEKAIFSTYMHLFVFAAMVGYELERSKELDSGRRGPAIYDDTFARNNLDGVAFLLALQEERSGDILRDKMDSNCWRYIESYANAGFEVIDKWLLDNAGDTSGVETLLNRMKEQAAALVSQGENDSVPDVTF